MKLEDPSTIRALWGGFLLFLAMLCGLEFIAHHHTHFVVGGTPFFSVWFGWGSCVVMVVFAKLIVGSVLKRKDTYYDG